jgi:squalene-hopene/tetraprenyl-beta-curcumene cyclase
MIRITVSPQQSIFRRSYWLTCVALSGMLTVNSVATTQVKAAISVDRAKLHQAVSRAASYFEAAQADNGSWSAASGPGVTAIVTAGLLRSGRSPDDPMVARALKYLEQFLHDDGGMYGQGSTHTNYETCVAIAAFKEANKDGRYNKLLADAEKYIKEEQWDAGEGYDESSMYYGGAGYGGGKRPDLSNTSFLVDALHSLGSGDDDPAIQKALIFVSRCQNLESPYNTTKFAPLVDDGGFYYTIAAGGSSIAGTTADGGLRSYGSMSYAGLRSLIYAGLKQDDPRVKAATEWIKKNYSLTENPGMKDAGLYYYYHTFAKTFDALGDDEFVDAQGKSHNWRAELANQLISLQKEDGSWVNSTTRFLEGDPNLVTAYSLLALSYTQPK